MNIKIPSYKNVMQLSLLAIIGLLVSSCSSYQSVSDSDGIYSSGTTAEVVVEEEVPADGKSNYYKQYFNTKSQELDDIPIEENLVFTDIESYTTTETVDEEGNIIIEEPSYQEEQYGAWGSNSDDIIVNVYNTGGLGWYGGLGWNRPWGLGWGWGWNAWNSPYWGWGHWYGGWGLGWGFGGFYNPWFCPPGFGGYAGIYSPYYRGQYGYAHHYNRGRSNQSYQRGNSLRRGRSSVASRNSYSRSETARRSGRSYVGRDGRSTTRNRVTRGVRNTSRTSVDRNTRRSNTRTTRPNTSTTRPRTTRPSNTRSSRPVRSSRPSYSRPSSSRSSGSRGGGVSRGGGRRGRG
ncbi:hypothetical protein [Aureisphaera sp.]